jgi:glycosyltransferase involved in cell wall biosynthesis
MHSDRIALLYDDSAYVETLKRPDRAPPGGPAGLMGRQVAGKEFLDAYVTSGSWNECVALVANRASRESLAHFCRSHPAWGLRPRRVEVVDLANFHRRFFPEPPARQLYLPCPPDPKYAWARQHGGPGSFALSGVTHTICSANVIQIFCEMVTAPFEPFDTLICTSQAAVDVVRAVTDTYAAYLRERHGGDPRLRLNLARIPLGVDTVKYRPPTAEERAAQRKALQVADDEVAVLFVGRLSFHAKAHPYPMFHGVAEAARQTGQKVHLLLAGWAANESILRAFQDGARAFAAGLRVTFLDGTRPDIRYGIWKAADVFTSLSDNIQETFGLVIVEAMASGLPVVASDWNGYRDLVRDGETGLLVPTLMVQDATIDSTARLLVGEVNYDHFLGETNQAVTVDPAAATAAYARLLGDPALRARLGAAGRERALAVFDWAHVVKAYEALWGDQERERQAFAARLPAAGTHRGPALYPTPEASFAGYPTRLLGGADFVQTAPGAEERLSVLLSLPLTNYAERGRSTDPAFLRALLAAARTSCALTELDHVARKAGVPFPAGRASAAWLLKYGLLRRATGPAT